jgi:hypothetical protein
MYFYQIEIKNSFSIGSQSYLGMLDRRRNSIFTLFFRENNSKREKRFFDTIS